MDVAAGFGEQVRASVSGDVQTAIVTGGATIRLDWLRWVSEVLGDRASGANYTIRRTQLDESGNPVGQAEVLRPSDPDDRILVNFNSGENEYYVQISRVVAVAGAEDPDRTIYDLEACVPRTDGSMECFRSNMTVFAIEFIEPLGTDAIIITLFCVVVVTLNFQLLQTLLVR